MGLLGHLHRTRWRRRRRELEKKLELTPQDAHEWVRLAEALRVLGEDRQAVEAYRAAALLWVDSGALQRAQAALRLALKLAPAQGTLAEELKAMARQLARRREELLGSAPLATRAERPGLLARASPRPAHPAPPALAEQPTAPTLPSFPTPSQTETVVDFEPWFGEGTAPALLPLSARANVELAFSELTAVIRRPDPSADTTLPDFSLAGTLLPSAP